MLCLSLPVSSLDRVKTPNKETHALLLLSKSECYVVVVSIIVDLIALCKVVLRCPFMDRVTQHWQEGFWRVEERAVDEGPCCRDLSCFTYWNMNLLFFFIPSQQVIMSETVDQVSIPEYSEKTIATNARV